ncbi:expressed unknown protein [Seminavis robusta]|uniref:DUF6824 domain-containing protein n=1 Tax=Seminavis robusta TaxID=568900 RepID=A0A9N8H9K9_9STRA|nr:expressed unknown protein [Seminavis robusta]|eukprot:Sro258_g101170.1 n/a (398) ;mRNA; f:70448-71886
MSVSHLHQEDPSFAFTTTTTTSTTTSTSTTPSTTITTGQAMVAVMESDVGIEFPGDHDLLLGRGGETNSHSGNQLFRRLIEAHKAVYISAPRRSKPDIAKTLVAQWRAMDPPGRFLAKKMMPGQSKKLWYEIGDDAARKRTSKSLGEKKGAPMALLASPGHGPSSGTLVRNTSAGSNSTSSNHSSTSISTSISISSSFKQHQDIQKLPSGPLSPPDTSTKTTKTQGMEYMAFLQGMASDEQPRPIQMQMQIHNALSQRIGPQNQEFLEQKLPPRGPASQDLPKLEKNNFHFDKLLLLQHSSHQDPNVTMQLGRRMPTAAELMDSCVGDGFLFDHHDQRPRQLREQKSHAGAATILTTSQTEMGMEMNLLFHAMPEAQANFNLDATAEATKMSWQAQL